MQSGYPTFDTTWDQTQTEHSGRMNFAPVCSWGKITPESVWASGFHRMEFHSVFQFSALIITFFWDKLWISYRWVLSMFLLTGSSAATFMKIMKALYKFFKYPSELRKNFYFFLSKKTTILVEELLKTIKWPHQELRKG